MNCPRGRFYEAVRYVDWNGLMNGVSRTKFGSDQNTTRAMIVTILYLMAGEEKAPRDAGLYDVTNG